MKLTRTRPASTVEFTATACKLDFRKMSQEFRKIRSRCRNPLDRCEWCKHPFADGEMMALAFSDTKNNKGNKMLCQTCATDLISSESKNGKL